MPALVGAAIALVGLGNDDISLVSADSEAGSLGVAGYIVCCAALGVVLELLMIVVRFLNIGLINIKSTIFLTVVSSLTLITTIQRLGAFYDCFV